MVIVKHIKSGKYYKKGNFRSKLDNDLVEKSEATVYRNRAGAVMSLGSWELDDKPTTRYGYTRRRTHYVLDESVWEIVPVEIT